MLVTYINVNSENIVNSDQSMTKSVEKAINVKNEEEAKIKLEQWMEEYKKLERDQTKLLNTQRTLLTQYQENELV